MQRLSLRIATTLTVIILGFSATTMAFSFNIGAHNSRLSTTPTTNGADIPTPQLFQVTLGQRPTPAHLSFTSATPAQIKPAMRLQNSQGHETAASTSVAQPPTPQVSQAITAQPLSGSELDLLRQVYHVATKPETDRIIP